MPEGPLTDQIRWYVGVLRAGTAPTVAELQEHFAPSVFAQLPPAQLRAAVQQVIALEPQQLTAFSGDAQQGVAVLGLAGGKRLLVTVAVDGSGKLSALLNQPAPPLPTITTPGDLVEAATAVGAAGTLLVADDSCRPLAASGSGLDADKAVPLGSMFKLYVLGAVTQAVADGRLQWTDTLTIDAAIRSFPSGELQDSPANTKVTVQQAATLMISISDNTATDALIRAVGARAVEAAVAKMGSRHPGLLSPFPTTKQIFALAADAPLRKQWAATFDRAADGTMAGSTAAQIAARRALIAKIPGSLPSLAAFSGAPAGWPDGVEWFASATDICRAQVALHTMAQTAAGAPLQAILTMNPGIGDLGVPTTSVAFKGGSDTGVLTGSWLVVRNDGDVRVLVWMMRADSATQIPDTQYFAVAARSALRLLAR